ncbi:putative ataxia telangiectasia mutated [Planoprotostelium fungivorum]|uniref:Serine/threonine-protein kinase ATM n=1 Tax=Planoprotostelium fungivorum TaxID=1890364 RepID=A0A2P6N446_9EUKA|nr:putative ataxia telangiectasia mutated [Planoprotostelium fungivorum]
MSEWRECQELCVQLKDGSTASRRKEALESLKTKVEASSFLHQLDAASSKELEGHNTEDKCSWCDIIINLMAAVSKELSSIKKTTPQIIKLRREWTSALQNMVKIADARGPRLFLCLRQILQHIIESLRDEDLWDIVGYDYLHIVNENICSTPPYCHLLTRNDLHEITQYITNRLLKDAKRDAPLLARTLYSIVHNYPFDQSNEQQLNLLVRFYSKFYSQSWLLSCGVNVISNESVLHLLTSVNTIIKRQWGNLQGELKEQSVLFLRLELRLLVDYDGTIALPSEFRDIYDLLFREIANSKKNRLSFNKEDKGVNLEETQEHLLDLCADLFIHYNVKMENEIKKEEEEEEEKEGQRKRRKITTDWDLLMMEENEDANLCISRLQLISFIVRKPSKILSDRLAVELITSIVSYLDKYKDPHSGLEYWSYEALFSFLSSSKHKNNENLWKEEIWTTVWNIMMKRLNVPGINPALEKGYHLIQSILRHNCIDSSLLSSHTSFWSLPFISSHTSVKGLHIRFETMISLIESYDIKSAEGEANPREKWMDDILAYKEDNNRTGDDGTDVQVLISALSLFVRSGPVDDIARGIYEDGGLYTPMYQETNGEPQRREKEYEEIRRSRRIEREVEEREEQKTTRNIIPQTMSHRLIKILADKLSEQLTLIMMNVTTDSSKMGKTWLYQRVNHAIEICTITSAMIHIHTRADKQNHLMNRLSPLLLQCMGWVADTIAKVNAFNDKQILKIYHMLSQYIPSIIYSLFHDPQTRLKDSPIYTITNSLISSLLMVEEEKKSGSEYLHHGDSMDLDEGSDQMNASGVSMQSSNLLTTSEQRQQVLDMLCKIFSSIHAFAPHREDVLSWIQSIAKEVLTQLDKTDLWSRKHQMCLLLINMDGPECSWSSKSISSILPFVKSQYSKDTRARLEILYLVKSILDRLNRFPEAKQKEQCVKGLTQVFDHFRELWRKQKQEYIVKRTFARVLESALQLAELDQVAPCIIEMINDIDYRVRMKIGKGIHQIFKCFDNEVGIYQDISTRLGLDGVRETRLTSLYLLSRVAVISPANEQLVLFQLLQHYSTKKRDSTMVAYFLSLCAADLHYNHTKSLLEYHMVHIITSWLSEYTSLDQFPIELFEQDKMEDFIEGYQKTIVPQLIFSKDEQNLKQCAKLINTDVRTLLRNNFAQVFAKVFPLYFCDEKLANEVCEGMLNRWITPEDHNEIIPKQLDVIVVELLNNLSFEEDVSPPKYSPDSITKILNFLSESWQIKISDVLYGSRYSDRIYKIISSLNERMFNTRRGDDRIRISKSFIYFVNLFKEKQFRPAIMRDIISTLLRFLPFNEVRPVLWKFILDLVDRAKENKVNASEFGKHVNAILRGMIPIATSEKEGSDKALKIITNMYDCIGNHLEQSMKESDPLPHHPLLDDPLKLETEMRGETRLRDEMIRFLREGRQEDQIYPSNSIRLENILYIKELITSRKEELNQIITSEEHRGLISELMWNLLYYCRNGLDEKIRNTSGDILGLIGAVDPHAITFLHKNQQREAPSLSNGKVQVMQRLNQYIAHMDVYIMRCAAYSLKNVLNTHSGKVLLENVNENTKSYITPFMQNKKTKTSRTGTYPSPMKELPEAVGIDKDRLWDTSLCNYPLWISSLSYHLCLSANDEIFRLCAGMCYNQFEFAEFLFPYLLMDIILDTKSKKVHQMISSKISTWLLSNKNNNDQAIHLILDTVDTLRRVTTLLPTKGRDNVMFYQKSDIWHNIHLLDVARLSYRAGAFFTSLQYIELSSEREFGSVIPSDKEERSVEYTRLMMDAYSNINEPDGIYGIQTRHHTIESQITTYEHEGHWNMALGAYDLLSDPSVQKDYSFCSSANSLHRLGHWHILDVYLAGLSVKKPSTFAELSEHQYRNAWREGRWNFESSREGQMLVKEAREGINFESSSFKLLRCFSEGEYTGYSEYMQQGKSGVIKNILGSFSPESTKNIHPALVQLQFLDEINDVYETTKGKKASIGAQQWHLMESQRKGRNEMMKKEFRLFEPLFDMRGVLLDLVAEEKDKMNLLKGHFLQYSKMARKASDYQLAFHAVNRLRLYMKDQYDPSCLLEEANIVWSRGEQERAIQMVRFINTQITHESTTKNRRKTRGLTDSSHMDANDILRAQVLFYLGKWLSETKAEGVSSAQENLKDAIDLFHQQKSKKLCKGYITLAGYVDSLYEGIMNKIQSSEWETSQKLRRHKETELTRCKKMMESLTGKSIEVKTQKQEIQRHITLLERQTDLDRQENDKIQEDLKRFLEEAIDYYCKCLIYGETYNIRAIFRLCSLWFNNTLKEDVNKLLEKEIGDIPSRKFIPLMYQIASRMNASENTTFQKLIGDILEMSCTQHPHHTLYQLFALSNGSKVDGNGKGRGRLTVDQDKINAAMRKHRQLLKEMTFLIDCYIELAFLDCSSKKKEKGGIPLPGLIKKIDRQQLVPVTTVQIPVNRDGDYTDPHAIPFITGFGDTYSLVGGLNLPKLIICHASNGKRYKQLVKGHDDLRQDGVMQQIFSLLNNLLTENENCRRRKLRIRTYKVIPLTPAAGLLEWVENTTPIGEYLIGGDREGAHSRYRPGDIASNECRKVLNDSSEKTKYDTYVNICNRFKPVFHHFFLENFSSPAEWFDKRLQYTRSTASNSIIGYIVGLGDRHAHNILIDKTSAELVHIDLGVAFEQGKTLRTPELVPFRLTRDIIDAMGITGCEGVFRSCCKETMQLLRDNHNSLITIVEVFMHDPLYRWALSPVQALELQREDHDYLPNMNTTNDEVESTNMGNTDAGRALIRLKQKLSGYEYGEGLTVNHLDGMNTDGEEVEGQVNKLISESQDPQKLCKMFPG